MSKNLNNAFRQLRKSGYFARQNFACCQNCGWAEVPEDSEKVVFYHAQDNDEKKKNKPFHLAWSGDGHEISKIFQENGVVTEWDGSDNKRIKVVSW